MKNIGIIFPNQLFETKYLPYDPKLIDVFVIIEDCLFFHDKERKLKFNLLKLIYQRACMKYYYTYLKKKFSVEYLEWNEKKYHLFEYINQKYGKGNNIYIIDPVDHLLEARINTAIIKYGQNLKLYETPQFLSTNNNLNEYMSNKKQSNHFYQYNFYIWQRKYLNILLDKNGKPIGKKYSYDKYNRDPIPGKKFENFIEDNKIKYPFNETYNNSFYTEAISYCEKVFKNYYPENYRPENIYLFPVTHTDTKYHFKLFIKYKLEYFGLYEDAIDYNHWSLFHAVVSPQLNNGLIVPKWILNKIINYFNSSKKKNKILFDVEGFIRQLNWREYSRLVYRYAYDRMISNYFGNKKKLDRRWYDGTTGIMPVDLAIKQAFQYGYIHHIIRLMVVCNFMNLCRIDPSDAYNWFMEFSLDSYDWVMINNVYSMGFFADGGITTTKPYISSSNYVIKQSNIHKDNHWNIIWDTLFYYFIYKNYNKFNGRGKIYQIYWDKRSNKKNIIKYGKKFIKKLTT